MNNKNQDFECIQENVKELRKHLNGEDEDEEVHSKVQ